jgi:hypothetical protein
MKASPKDVMRVVLENCKVMVEGIQQAMGTTVVGGCNFTTIAEQMNHPDFYRYVAVKLGYV